MTSARKCVDQNCLSQETTVRAIDKKGIRQERTEDSQTEMIEKDHNEIDIRCLTLTRFLKTLKRSDHQVYCFYPKGKFERKLARYQKRVLCAATAGAIQQSDHEKFMQPKQSYTVEDLKRRVPEAYHSEIDVFNQVKADELPPHREEDHEINLTPGSEPPFIKSYKPMSEQELAAAKKYLDEHLEKGFIRPSSSKAAAPVLFVRKPSGGLRFCVDYRKLNEITEKNRYPIPLINETLTRLSKASVFTKLDVIAAFNKIRIKAGQEWMTAFNTRYGQFEYLVLPFGLCNAPSTFKATSTGPFENFWINSSSHLRQPLTSRGYRYFFHGWISQICPAARDARNPLILLAGGRLKTAKSSK